MLRSLTLRLAAIAGLALLLSGCGILIGQMMVMGTGVKDFKVTQGELAQLQRGKIALMIAPFDTEGTGYEPARGDTAVRFAEDFERLGLFSTRFHFVQAPGKMKATAAELAAKTPAEIAQELSLDVAPDYIITGTILANDMVVAPMRGVIQESTYRLTFLDLSTKKTVTVELAVKELYRDAVPRAAEAINARVK